MDYFVACDSQVKRRGIRAQELIWELRVGGAGENLILNVQNEATGSLPTQG